MAMSWKQRENRLRRLASRRGLRLLKEPGDLSWGNLGAYVILDGKTVLHTVHQVVRKRKVTAADWHVALDSVEGLLLLAERRTPRERVRRQSW